MLTRLLVVEPLKKEKIVPLFLLSLFYAAFFLYLIIISHLEGGISEQEEMLIFIKGWLIVPACTLIVTILIIKLHKRYFKGEYLFYPILLIVNAIYWLVAINALRLTDVESVGLPAKSLISLMTILFFAVNILALFIIKGLHFFLDSDRLSPQISKLIYFCLPLIVTATILINFSGSGMTIVNASLLWGVAICSFLCLFHRRLIEYEPRRNLSQVINATVLILVVFLVFNPQFHYEGHHHNFFLGATSDLIAGKSMLVDISCQYGVLVIYFIKAFFTLLHMPLSYQGLAFLVTILLIGLYTLVYFILRYVLKSVLFSIIALLLIIEFNFFAQIDHLTSYPSTGPLRFGFPYLLLLLTMMKERYPRYGKSIAIGECVLIAVASAWSTDAFLFLLLIYGSMLVYECVGNSMKFVKAIRLIIGKLLFIGLFMIIVHSLLAVDIFIRSGQLPHWNYYFEYVFEYAGKGHAFLLIPPRSPWIVFPGISFVSLMIFVYLVFLKKPKVYAPELKIILGFTVFSIIHFTYFVGRSHPNNLLHICIAPIVIASFWLVNLTRRLDLLPVGFYPSFIYCCYFSLSILFVSQTSKITSEIKEHIQAPSVYAEKILLLFLPPKPSSLQVADTLYLIKKYASNKNRVAIFTSETTEVYMISGKANVFPYNYIQEINVSPPACVRALNFDHGFKSGDIIFINFKNPRFFTLERFILQKLHDQFDFVTKEGTLSGVFAVELKKKKLF